MSKQRPDLPPAAPVGEKKPAAVPPAGPVAEAKPKPKPKPAAPSPWPWGPAARIAVSLAVVFHLTVAFTAPWFNYVWSMVGPIPVVEPGGEPRDESGRVIPPEELASANYPVQRPELPRAIILSLRHYANLLFINHGYEFFSPDPAVSHVLRYEVYSASGEKLAAGQFPRHGEQWPRLLYHRHMMLVEQLRPEQGDAWLRDALHRVGQWLVVSHGGQRARLQMYRRHLLAPHEVLRGERISSESLLEPLATVDHALVEEPKPTPAMPGGEI